MTTKINALLVTVLYIFLSSSSNAAVPEALSAAFSFYSEAYRLSNIATTDDYPTPLLPPCTYSIVASTSKTNVCVGDNMDLQLQVVGAGSYQTKWYHVDAFASSGPTHVLIGTTDTLNVTPMSLSPCTQDSVKYYWAVYCGGSKVDTGYVSIRLHPDPMGMIVFDSVNCSYSVPVTCTGHVVEWQDGSGATGTGVYDASTLTVPMSIIFKIINTAAPATLPCYATYLSITANPCGGIDDKCLIEWQNLVNVTLNMTNDLVIKASSTTAWDAGAISTDYLPAAQDGCIEMEVIETNQRRAFAFAQFNTTTNLNQMNYAIVLNTNTTVQIRELGVVMGTFGTYSPADKFTIERTAGVVRYKKNGVVFYTSTVPSTTDLYADIALNTSGATIFQARKSFGCDDAPCNLSVSASTNKTDVCVGDNVDLQLQVVGTGSYQTKWYYVDAFASSGPTHVLIGTTDTLNVTPLSLSPCTQDSVKYYWAVYCGGSKVDTGYVSVRLHPAPTGMIVFDSINCTYSIPVICAGHVVEWQDGSGATGTGVYDASTLTAPMSVVFKIINTAAPATLPCYATYLTITANPCGGNVDDKCLIKWKDLVNVTINTAGDLVTKASPTTGWDAGAISIDYLPAAQDGCIEMEVIETNQRRAFAFAQFNTTTNLNQMDYTIVLNPNATVQIRELGVVIGTFGTYSPADKFAIERTAGVVRYKKNGVVFYTSTVPSTTDLYADIALNTSAPTIFDARQSFGCNDDPCIGFSIIVENIGAETCAGANDGFVDISVTMPNTTYQWLDDPNYIHGDRNNMAPGNYTLIAQVVGSTCTDTLFVHIGAGPSCNPYFIPNDTLPCDTTFFCVPLMAGSPVPNGIQGFDYCLNYNPAVMVPTGIVQLGNVVTNGGSAAYNFSDGMGQVNVGVYYTSGAGSYLTGAGEILCIEFRLIHGYATLPGNYPMMDCGIIETYDPVINPAIDVFTHATAGVLTLEYSTRNSLNGQMIYRNDFHNPIVNLPYSPAKAFISEAYTTLTGGCLPKLTTLTEPISPPAPAPHWGYFQLNLTPSTMVSPLYLIAERDIADTAFVMDVINGADAVKTWGLMNGIVPNPTIFDLISADVNGSTVLTSGDITLLHQRSTLFIPTFPNGVKDWYFLTDSTLATPSYTPTWAGGLADRFNVPNPDYCLVLDNYGNQCSKWNDEVLHGVLMGDVTGNWLNIVNGINKSNDELIVDIAAAVSIGNNQYRIPVRYNATALITSVDFSLDYDENNLSVQGVITDNILQNAGVQMVWNDYQNDRLMLSSSIINGVQTTQPLFWIEATALNGHLKDYHFSTSSTAFLNGEPSQFVVTGSTTTATTPLAFERLSVFPNPFNSQFIVDYRDYVQDVRTIDLFSTNGVHLRTIPVHNTGISEVNASDLPNGVYIVRINSDRHYRIVKLN